MLSRVDGSWKCDDCGRVVRRRDRITYGQNEGRAPSSLIVACIESGCPECGAKPDPALKSYVMAVRIPTGVCAKCNGRIYERKGKRGAVVKLCKCTIAEVYPFLSDASGVVDESMEGIEQ